MNFKMHGSSRDQQSRNQLTKHKASSVEKNFISNPESVVLIASRKTQGQPDMIINKNQYH